MGEMRGNFTKKILHIGHIILEFLRHIVKAFGKSDHAVNSVEKTASKGVSKSLAGKTSASAGSKAGSSALGGSSAAGASGISAAGIAGAIISVKALAVVLIASSLFLGSIATYSYVNHQSPTAVIGSLLNSPNNAVETSNPTNQNINLHTTLTPITSLTNPLIQESYGETSDVETSSEESGESVTSNLISQSQSQNNNNNPASVTETTTNYDNGNSTPSINYTVPENP
jgi:hypothetical protein